MVQIHTTPGQAAHETVELTIDDPDLAFDTAQERARATARDINANAMQLAWYNRRADQGFPNYECGAGDRPAWQVFAESRGCNLIIDVNQGAYRFFYLTM